MSFDILPLVLAHLKQAAAPACVIISGEIGAGKTSFGKRLAESLSSCGTTLGGILAPRVMEDGETIGYNVLDLETATICKLASIDPPGIKVGKYYLSREALDFSLQAVASASTRSQVVFLDEVGRLELQGKGHASATRILLDSPAKAILMIRSTLVKAIVECFSISDHAVFSVENIPGASGN